MNRNTTATVGQAQRVNQTDGKCTRHPRTSSNPDGNGSGRTESMAAVRCTTVGPRSEGFHNQPPKPVMNGQPARPLRRPATRPTHGKRALFTDHATTIREIRCQALRVGGYAVRYTYSEREKRWKVFVRLDRETYPDCKNPVIGMTA